MHNTQISESCTILGCLSDRAYAVVNPKTKKVHRISFSRSLLDHIVKTHKDLEVREISFRLGKTLKPNEKSSTGFYALVKTKNNWTLRISLYQNIANYLCDFDTRSLRECIITKVH